MDSRLTSSALAVLLCLFGCGPKSRVAPAPEEHETESAYDEVAEGRRGDLTSGQVVPYVKTPEPVIATMLEVGRVGAGDTVYDLGCGDGRMVIAAVGAAGAGRGVGVEIVPDIAEEARAKVRAAGLGDRIEILTADIFDIEMTPASVAMLYLLFTVNMRLRPHLIRDLRPGARVVSHRFTMGDAWPPDEVHRVMTDTEHEIYGWVVPAAVGGLWRGEIEDGLGTVLGLRLEQVFQRVEGTREGAEPIRLRDGRLDGRRLRLGVGALELEGTVAAGDGGRISGRISGEGYSHRWYATRVPVKTTGEYVWQQGEGEGAVEHRLVVGGSGMTSFATLVRGGEATRVTDFYLWGASLWFNLGDIEHGMPSATYRGQIGPAGITGTLKQGVEVLPWDARRGSEGAPSNGSRHGR